LRYYKKFRFKEWSENQKTKQQRFKSIDALKGIYALLVLVVPS